MSTKGRSFERGVVVAITVTDLFCGAGGSSLGAESVAGVRLEMAANHWKTAIDVHQARFPHARHDLADISQADPRRYPATNVLIASPECTNHSKAKGVSRRAQHPDLLGNFDAAAERSRATMWDVGRFAEQLHYDAIVVENVVEATAWTGWRHWLAWLTDLGYEHRVVSANSMHFGVPQSRDRIYVAFWRRGLHPDLELEVTGFCWGCEDWRPVRQAWKNGRSVGRFRQQWYWACTTCGATAWTVTEPAASIIDWALPCPKIGDRSKPLAPATRARILAGLCRYGWLQPIVTAGAGNVYETTPGNRARSLLEPLPVQQTSATAGLVQPPGPEHLVDVSEALLFQTAHGGRFSALDGPHPTVCASDDRHALLVPLRNHALASSTQGPMGTVVASNAYGGLLVRSPVAQGPGGRPVANRPTSLPVRNNEGGTGMVRPVSAPVCTATTHDRAALLDPDRIVDECGFRMLEPHEIAAAMSFPEGYIPSTLTKRERVRLAGNAVTPPVMAWLVDRVVRALEEAA